MSGTSLDGIDAALIDVAEDKIKCLHVHFQSYPESLRKELLEIHHPGFTELHRAALLSQQLARLYAATAERLLAELPTRKRRIRAMGCHGQTVRHAPESGYTIQLNNPALLAELTGISVVADFRSRDIAAGGQGAPLVPAFHENIFKDKNRHRLILNLGGIANITDLHPDRPTRGFDCGPGNMLLDAWVYRHTGKAYDNGGKFAQSGQCLPSLLSALEQAPYLQCLPPKSCGREQFNLEWLDRSLTGAENPADIQATLSIFTVSTICAAIRRWCGKPEEIYVCGGGVHNTLLMAQLAEYMPETVIDTTAALGVAPDWVEAIAFAWLAHRTLEGKSGNLPKATGAKGPRILGAIYPA